MKSFVPFTFFALALAAPHDPTTIENLDSSFDIKCGKVTVAGTDIFKAASWGINNEVAHQTLTSSDGNAYPHYYGNSENFKWVSSQCDKNLYLMPIIKGGYFGENGNDDASKYRVAYSYSHESDSENHPLGYYCGTIYHAKSDNSFDGCDV